jgi:hypothetical protein
MASVIAAIAFTKAGVSGKESWDWELGFIAHQFKCAAVRQTATDATVSAS